MSKENQASCSATETGWNLIIVFSSKQEGDTFGTGQTARKCRLVYLSVIRIQQSTFLSHATFRIQQVRANC